MRLNAAHTLLAPHAPERIALICGETTLTYGALLDTVARAAAAFRARGLERGDRVAVMLPDGIAWAQAFFGAMWAGGVPVGVNPRIPADEWAQALGEAGFRFILTESLEGTPPAFRDRILLLSTWLADATEARPMEPLRMEETEPAFWTHSSGTTGKPKAVIHGHRFAHQVERASVERLGIRPEDRLYASSRLFFAYPLGNSLLAGLKLGATVILDAQWPTAESVVEVVKTHRPTVFFSVPALYRALLKSGLARTLVRHGPRICVSAGEALPARLREAWCEETGLTVLDGYGASETLTLAMVDTGDGHGLRPSPGVRVEPLNPSPDGAPTRIAVQAPALALGYWQRPEAEAQAFRDGAYRPADLFLRTDALGWRFAGREDALVKVSGRWVNLIELEERLAGCPGVMEAAAVTVPDEDGVEAVALFYVQDPRCADDLAARLRAQAQGLPHYQRPLWLHPIEALPRTVTGKLMRRRLAELHRGERRPA